MPDWSYQPLLRPLLFALPAEQARRTTMGLLATQARLPGGPALFRALAPGLPPPNARTSFVGIDLSSAVGIGAGIDVDGRAAALLQQLAVGFVEIGPLGHAALAREPTTDPRRLKAVHGLALSAARGGPAVENALGRLPPLHPALAVALRGPRLLEAVVAARTRAAFLTLGLEAGDSSSLLREVRAAAGDVPVLVRVLAGWEPRRVAAVVRRARAAGIDGVLVVSGTAYPALVEGELHANGALPRALAVVEQVAEALPTALTGGVLTPKDGVDARAAGAGLIALTDGLVYAGPGLPDRINRRLARAAKPPAALDPAPGPPAVPLTALDPAPDTAAAPLDGQTRFGRLLLAIASAAVTVGGLGYLVLAATIQLLPNDTHHLGMSIAELCRVDDCRVVDFIAHDRAAFGGVASAIGVLYIWLVAGPLRRREPWAWWALLLSGLVGYLGFLSFVGYGYLDTWHAAATCALIAVWAPGLWLTRRSATAGVGLREAIRRPAAHAWLWSPAGRGRLGLLLLASGMLSAGVTILFVAITTVFVPQDTAFLQLDRAELDAISPRLVAVIAHDRAEFGAGLFAVGLLLGLGAWKGIRPGARGAWCAFAAAGFVMFGAAFVAHPAISYTSFTHLAPVYAGVLLLAAALLPLRAAVQRPAIDADSFPDV